MEVDGLMNSLFLSKPPRILAHYNRLSKFKGVMQVDKLTSCFAFSFPFRGQLLPTIAFFAKLRASFLYLDFPPFLSAGMT